MCIPSPQPCQENLRLPAQRSGRTAIPEDDASAVHFFCERKLRGENFVSKFHGKFAAFHEACQLRGRTAGDDDLDVAGQGKAGFIEQRDIGKEVRRSACGGRGLLRGKAFFANRRMEDAFQRFAAIRMIEGERAQPAAVERPVRAQQFRAERAGDGGNDVRFRQELLHTRIAVEEHRARREFEKEPGKGGLARGDAAGERESEHE